VTEELQAQAKRGRWPVPFLDAGGTLVVPFASPVRYRWWTDGGMEILDILRELAAPAAVLARYQTEREQANGNGVQVAA
jgi:hypothetical protein